MFINNTKYESRITHQTPGGQANHESRLIDLLRDELKLTGTKEGCGEGECGACSVILNGKLVNSCLIPVGQLNDSDEILTIEGVEKLQLGKKLQKSFVAAGAIQCGFCTPGMILAAYALLRQNKKPTIEEIKDSIAGNLCRCTGYKKIVEAIEMVVIARPRSGRGNLRYVIPAKAGIS